MMKAIAVLITLASLLSAPVLAEDTPGPGKLLVATDEIKGPVFAESVILLLSYDRSGAIGLVVNRPTEVKLSELLEEDDTYDWYANPLYWGGPVEMHTLRALVKSDRTPKDGLQVFDTVHIVPMDEERLESLAEDHRLRLFLGYAGWAPGQLDYELQEGSWRVLDATEATVFTDNPEDIWRTLNPPAILSVSL